MKNLLMLFLIATLVSCVVVDDQRELTKEMSSVVNPVPLDATRIQNQKHEILVAIIDTGVDYNHPLLASNIHYDFDDIGNVLGTGYDFVGEDYWPSPYLAFTANQYEKSPRSLKKKELKMIKGADLLLNAHPEYASFIDRIRDIGNEISSGADHGTHVAGLASYDNDKIGIVPFRILPHYQRWSQRFDNRVSVVDIILNAMEAAVKSGAKVINMSIGKTFDRSSDSFEEFLQEYSKIEKFVQNNPEVLFVAAAGNDGKWVDADSRYNWPCGIKASNMICVGSLSEEDHISSFSNIPILDVPVVFTLGENLISTTPTKMCPAIESKMLEDLGGAYTETLAMMSMGDIVKKINAECINRNFELRKMSGTSMASPLIARALAEVWLEDLEIDASLVLNTFLSRATVRKIGGILPVKSIKIKKPSWYKLYSLLNQGEDKSVQIPLEDESDYFEFISK